AYAIGHPHFDGARPIVLDKPFTAFHRDVNLVARDGLSVIGTLDGARRMEYLMINLKPFIKSTKEI
ncbi:MAG: hypothetical protein WCH83_12260, partial [Alphaproteobacteria bacterium]